MADIPDPLAGIDASYDAEDVQAASVMSLAISAKRQAAALETIAEVLDGKRGYGLNELVETLVGIERKS